MRNQLRKLKISCTVTRPVKERQKLVSKLFLSRNKTECAWQVWESHETANAVSTAWMSASLSIDSIPTSESSYLISNISNLSTWGLERVKGVLAPRGSGCILVSCCHHIAKPSLLFCRLAPSLLPLSDSSSCFNMHRFCSCGWFVLCNIENQILGCSPRQGLITANYNHK